MTKLRLPNQATKKRQNALTDPEPFGVAIEGVLGAFLSLSSTCRLSGVNGVDGAADDEATELSKEIE